MKILLNKCYGGFGISHKAKYEYYRRKGLNPTYYVENYTNKSFHRASTSDLQYVDNNMRIYVAKDDYGKVLDKDEFWDNYTYVPNYELRDDKILIEIVEEMGDEVDGDHAKLVVKSIPDDMEYEITEYDGIETLREKHRSW